MILQRIPAKRFGPMIAKLMSEKGTVAELFELLKIYDDTAKGSDEEEVNPLATKSFMVKRTGKKNIEREEDSIDQSESDDEGKRNYGIECYFCHFRGHKEVDCEIKKTMSEELRVKAEKKYGKKIDKRDGKRFGEQKGTRTLYANVVNLDDDDDDSQAF